jgi:hypothetical protein
MLDLSSRHCYGPDYISVSIDALASTSTQLSDCPSLSCEYYRFTFMFYTSDLVLVTLSILGIFNTHSVIVHH